MSLMKENAKKISDIRRSINRKEIVAIRKKDGKITHVEIRMPGSSNRLESIEDVIKNYNNYQGYEVYRGEEVKPFNNDTEIHSHRNDVKSDNLGKLPLSKL